MLTWLKRGIEMATYWLKPTAFKPSKRTKDSPRLFPTEEKIVEIMLKNMGDDERQTWLDVEAKDLIAGHHTTGRFIRNTFHLWDRNHPVTRDAGPDSYNHPDQMSFRIMERVWCGVRGMKYEDFLRTKQDGTTPPARIDLCSGPDTEVEPPTTTEARRAAIHQAYFPDRPAGPPLARLTPEEKRAADRKAEGARIWATIRGMVGR